MGRAKALWFLWSFAGAIQTAATASAGELSPLPPAPPLEEPELRGSLGEDGGFYLRWDAGVASAYTSSPRSPYGVLPGGADGPVSLGDTAIVGVGAGYRYTAWLRADVTGEYRPGADYRARAPFNNADEYTGTLRSGLFLANAYVDFGDWLGFMPYVGAGLGAAVWQTSAIRDISLYPGASSGFARNPSGTGFAWDLTAGFAYRLSPNLLIDVNYRYVNMGSFKTGAIVCNSLADCHFGAQSFRLASNDVRVGLRWLAIEPPAPPVVGARY